jgi:predicted ATPase/class 3 adenylate cyclase
MADLPSGTVTFLFTDIEGSTRRWEQEPGAMADALALHDSILRDEIERRSGIVVSTMGDGFATVFGSASSAIACAFDAQRSLAVAAWPVETGALRVRMGLHTGEGVLRDGQYLNQPLNRCARLMGAAHGGQIVMSESTAALVRGDLPSGATLLDLGEHRFRDVDGVMHVFQLEHADLLSGFPPLRTVASSVGRLPVQLTSFVGRRRDLADVAAALATARQVTLTGPGGVGKTRLAIEAAHAHTAVAKWFVDLVPAGPDEVVASIATTLGVTDRPNLSLEQAVHEALLGQPTLVVLDNCEHVLDATAAVTARLLQACPDTVVLATSREVLGVPGERIVAVRPLEVDGDDDGAVALFVARAEAGGALLSADDREAIVEICARLDGMPLAIELAAARCATLGVDGVLDALGDRLLLLGRARGSDERHRSLRAVLDWSHGLLDTEEQAALRRVALFHGSFGLKDAGALADDDSGAAALGDAVARLVGKSLVVHGRGASRQSTYRLLETVRAYGLEKLAEAGEVDHVSARHLAWAIGVAGALEQELEATDAADPAVEGVFDNLRAALTWAVDRDRLAEAHLLARRLAHLAYGRRFVSEAQLRYQQAADYAADDSEAARDLLDAGHSAFAILHGDLGFACYLDAAERAERAGDKATAAVAMAMAAERGNRFRAEFGAPPDRTTLDQLLARAHALGDDIDDDRLAAQLVVASAWLSAERATTATVPAAQAAVDAARRSGDALLESSALDALAAAERDARHLAVSAEVCTERLKLLGRLSMHDPRTGSEQLDIVHMACDGLLIRGDLRRALVIARDWVLHPLGAGALHVTQRELVIALCLTGNFDESLEEADAMRLSWERMGRPVAGWMAPAVYLAAFVNGLRGERDAFDTWFELGEKVRVSPDHSMRAFTLVRLALHEGRLDDAEAAVQRYASIASTVDTAPWPATALDYGGYVWSTAAETWAARHEPDFAARLAELQTRYAEHLWAVPTLARAEWRATGDLTRLHAAVAGYAAIGAHFEEAATLALLPGPEGDAGRETLRSLGCSLPFSI